MRFVIAMMQHETNTFSPLPTPYSAFSGTTGHDVPLSGKKAIEAYGRARMPFTAFIDLAQQEGAEIVVPIAAWGEPSGPVENSAFEAMTKTICDAVNAGCDALMLDLHGAMVVENYDDGEGELLRRIRAIAPDLPIAVALDFHTNLTSSMVDNATVISGYRTYPHTDMYETGIRAGKILLRAMKGEIDPVMAWHTLPLLPHLNEQTPSRQPMKDVMDKAISAVVDGAVLDASIFGCFPLADNPHVGLSALAVTDSDHKAAEDLLYELLGMVWRRRDDFVFEDTPIKQSITYAKSLAEGPIILADHCDVAGSGGTQDVMAVLEEVMRQGLESVCAGPITDPEAVAQMIEAGEGSKVTLRLGGKVDMLSIGLKKQSMEVTGVVKRTTDGVFTITAPMMEGLVVNLGRTAVLETDGVEIVVCEARTEPFDIGFFTHAGIDPAQKKYILLKSRQHFRAGFESITKHIVMVSGLGITTSDYSQFPWEKLNRPIYPLDPETEWSPDRSN
jgi:microcystin degradation protein MlrC